MFDIKHPHVSVHRTSTRLLDYNSTTSLDGYALTYCWALVHFRTLVTLRRVRIRVRVGLELRLGLVRVRIRVRIRLGLDLGLGLGLG